MDLLDRAIGPVFTLHVESNELDRRYGVTVDAMVTDVGLKLLALIIDPY